MTADLMYGLVTGILFGFLLQKGRVLRYDKQIGALRLQDMTIVKFMLSAIVVGMIGTYLLVDLGMAKLSIKHSWSPTGQVTLSFGVARSVPAFGRSPEGLIASADAALYRAKSLGRNRIEVAALA